MSDLAAKYEPPRTKLDGREDLIVPFAGLLGDVAGKRVLEYGCGDGKLTVRLAQCGAWVSAFDSSRSSVEQTRRRAEASGVRVEAVEAAAERLPYADETFDVVLGRAVLHLLDVARARVELQRILKTGGRGVFLEPLVFDDLEAWGTGFSEFGYRELGLPARFNWIPFPRASRRGLIWMVR